MNKKLATLTAEQYARLCSLDYSDLYSIHHGATPITLGHRLEIFVAVNQYGRLYINVNFYPEGHRTFNFDNLDSAIAWVKKRVEIITSPKEDV